VTGPVLVVGCGSIGRRHLTNLRKLGRGDLVAFDPLDERLRLVRDDLDVRTVPSLAAGLEASPSAVIVCTPPHRHVGVARSAVEAGADVLIEKPIADRLDDVEELIAAAARRSRVIMVGYNLRFQTGLVRLKALLDDGAIGRVLTLQAEFGQYLPDWRPGQDYRAGHMVSDAEGGGVIREVSHELDYARWLAGEVRSVSAVAEHVSGLAMDAEDVAFVLLRFVSGALGHVALDCVQREYSRRCKVVGAEGTLVWELRGGLRLYRATTGRWEHFAVEQDVSRTYVDEMAHFLAVVRRERPPVVDGAEAARVLRIALAARESAKRSREIDV
jgi:predicted dehydrogenase